MHQDVQCAKPTDPPRQLSGGEDFDNNQTVRTMRSLRDWCVFWDEELYIRGQISNHSRLQKVILRAANTDSFFSLCCVF